MKRTIGVKSTNYNEKRNFAGLEIHDFKFKKVLDYYRVIDYVYFKIKGKPHSFWLNLFNNFGLGKADLYHFWNAVSVLNDPWLVTFEYYLPRGAREYGFDSFENKYIHFVMGRLAHSSCKKIIAISEFALNSQIRYIENYGKYKEEIISKIELIRPPQKLHFERIDEKIYSDIEIKFVMVGSDFFRKGGLELLKAFDSVSQLYKKFKLVIVSKLDYGDYVSFSNKIDQLNALEIINKNDQIQLFDSLPNSEVIDLFKSAHVGLLPSFEESYGYSVLEAQACGCPVITTNGAV